MGQTIKLIWQTFVANTEEGLFFSWRTLRKEELLAIYKDFVETDPPNFAIHAYK